MALPIPFEPPVTTINFGIAGVLFSSIFKQDNICSDLIAA
jgi:hypothetical protein